MNLKNEIRLIFCICFSFAVCTVVSAGWISGSDPAPVFRYYAEPGEQATTAGKDQILDKLNLEFHAAITEGDTAKSRKLLYSILKNLREENNNNLTTSNSQYYIGVYNLLSGKNSDAINWLNLSSSIRDQMKCDDEIHAKCLFNLGIAYSNLGDFRKMEQYILKSLEIEKKLYGESSSLLVNGYSALVNAYFGLNEYNKAIAFGNKALGLIGEVKKYNNYERQYFIQILVPVIPVCRTIQKR